MTLSTEPIDLIADTIEYTRVSRFYRDRNGRVRAGTIVLEDQPALQGVNEGLLLLADSDHPLLWMQALCLAHIYGQYSTTAAIDDNSPLAGTDPQAEIIAAEVARFRIYIETLTDFGVLETYRPSDIPGADSVLAALIFQELIDILVAEPGDYEVSARRLDHQLRTIGASRLLNYRSPDFD